MSPELISILALMAMFVIATLLPINIGILAFVGAFVLGLTLTDMDGETILEDGFPDELAVTLIGITLLFAMARNNGTIDWLLALAVRAVRGRLVAIPWVMFAITGVLTAFGAVSPAAVAIIAPVALGFAYRFQINPMLMGIMVVHGAQAGGFSPISIYGTITNQVVERANLEGSPLTLFLASLFFNLGIAIVGFFIFGGRSLLSRRTHELEGSEQGGTEPSGAAASRAETREAGAAGTEQAGPGTTAGGTATSTATSTTTEATNLTPTLYQLVTLVGLLGLAVGTLFYELDVGLTALTVALVLALISPQSQKSAIQHVSWSVVLLIGGVLTYVFVLEELGTVEYAGNAVVAVGAALLAAMLLCYVGGIVSAFASSTALLPFIIPLAVPLLEQGGLGAVGMVSALAVSSTVVDVSPFSTNGAIVLANSAEDDQDHIYRMLLIFGFSVVAIAPAVAWAVMIAPGWL
ncbi:MAG: SLC13 family permease [Actinomycetota bacterium]|nr:SLC13 family permease [Actinomycetota bacterium]